MCHLRDAVGEGGKIEQSCDEIKVKMCHLRDAVGEGGKIEQSCASRE